MKKILIFTADVFDDREFIYPFYRVQEAGYEVDVAGPEKGKYKSKNGFENEANLAFSDAKTEDYDALIIPGGYAPDKIRTSEDALRLTKEFKDAGKPIAMICHAGWVGASANVIDGGKMTSTPTIKDDMINAGANWVDEEVVVDKGFITSRKPEDLPAFMQALLVALQ